MAARVCVGTFTFSLVLLLTSSAFWGKLLKLSVACFLPGDNNSRVCVYVCVDKDILKCLE